MEGKNLGKGLKVRRTIERKRKEGRTKSLQNIFQSLQKNNQGAIKVCNSGLISGVLQPYTVERALVLNPITVSRWFSYAIEQSRPVQVVRWEAPTYGTFNINKETSRDFFYASEQSRQIQVVRWEDPTCDTFNINREVSRGVSNAIEQSKMVQMVRCQAPTCGAFNINIEASRVLSSATEQSNLVQMSRCEEPTCGTFNINAEPSRRVSYVTDQFKLVQMVRWEAPPCHTFKINVDGSFIMKSREAGIGGLIRNSNGQWIFGFSEPVKVEMILHAELLAIKKGLELAWNVGCRNVICETDSTCSLELIKRANIDVHMFREVIGEIRKICERKWERVELVHVFREGNQCADYLAKFGSKHPYYCLWMFPLYTMLKQLEDDARGTFYFRRKL